MVMVPRLGQKPSEQAVGGAELSGQVMGRGQTRSINTIFPAQIGPANHLCCNSWCFLLPLLLRRFAEAGAAVEGDCGPWVGPETIEAGCWWR